MKNEKLEAAKTYFEKAGFTGISDETLLELFSVIKNKREAVYEAGDFVAYYEGMGEMGHGEVIDCQGKTYTIQIWTPDETKWPSHKTVVSEGDMRQLSTPEQAHQYYLVRSGQA
jgi:hypothetical protein